jgi:hydroxymethylpyrimidine kinase/phosphomethylpyrimidine kinase
MKNKETKICLTIAGVDPSGGAGIIADIKTFSAFDCFATSAITSITFQNTQGVFGAEHQSREAVRKQIEPILDDYKIDALKTGMLPTLEVIDEIAEIINKNDLKNLVVDPVVRSTSGFDLIDDQALRCLIKRLFPLAKVITPNIPEAERISQTEIKTPDDIRKAAKIMQQLGAKNVLIKGGHLEGVTSEKAEQKIAKDYLFVEDELHIFEAEYIETTATHGTGCTLAAAITANLALGNSLVESVRIAKEFVNQAIKNAPHIGKGHSPIGI